MRFWIFMSFTAEAQTEARGRSQSVIGGNDVRTPVKKTGFGQDSKASARQSGAMGSVGRVCLCLVSMCMWMPRTVPYKNMHLLIIC